MYIINIILAIWAPHLAGSLAGYVRRKRISQLLREVSLGSREEIAEKILGLLKRKRKDEHLVGWSMIVLFLFVQLILPVPIFGKAIGVFLTLGIGMHRMFRDLPVLVLKAHESALRKELKLVTLAGEKVRAEGIMLAAARSQKPILQLLGVEWLVKWKSPWAVQHLEEVGQSTLNLEIRNLCESGYRGGIDLLRNEDLTHILNLRELVSQSRFWQRVAMAFQAEDALLWEGSEMDELEEKLVNAFRLQGELARFHPFNYCKTGMSRGELSQIHGWKYVLGRRSQDYREMIPEIYKVTGLIGPLEGEQTKLTGTGELIVQLWNAAENEASAAELDVLEVAAGADINYDWAVSAVIEALRNQSPDRELRIEVQVDTKVSLAPNTWNLLKEITK